MAQHMTILQTKHLVLAKIREAIKKDFHISHSMRTSMRYFYHPELSRQYGIANVDVYTVERKIGKGFVWGIDRGFFVILFNRKEKQVVDIYFVA